MYANSGYLHNSLIDFMDKSAPLVVGSCGTYRLYTIPKLPTYRPKGRLDFQLLYIAAGKAHFFLDGKDVLVTAGHMVLYQPREVQRYVYYGVDQTEVFWVHFTGSDVKRILRSYGINLEEHVFYCGKSPEYQKLFQEMIQEMQLCRPHYEYLLAILLYQLFIQISRRFKGGDKLAGYVQDEMEEAIRYFTEHYNTPIVIDQYAASMHRSTTWLIRSFKQYTGMTPMQFIISIRLASAQRLLSTTDCNVTEVASIVGYDNPLYFSRLFKKQTGMSPSAYRKNV
ncbi:MAG: AraC family transcriptional regulator [Lachnospiraceae bacterium]|nr:AraC family transcriptional regulator [Lachnospiraceae bacterium]